LKGGRDRKKGEKGGGRPIGEGSCEVHCGLGGTPASNRQRPKGSGAHLGPAENSPGVKEGGGKWRKDSKGEGILAKKKKIEISNRSGSIHFIDHS